ncbi:CubicO group peptidase, beta-lactamase class C family [Paenibacillaceae bacterium GAS479]|nr:CubicO group peptidase, beta-lactamase class C family [Paenibacillaceae bacterium GAS479]
MATGRMTAQELEKLQINPRMMEQLEKWKIKGVHAEQAGQELLHWNSSGEDRPAAILSCTKSVLSALIGIAIDQGIIGSVHDSIVPYLDGDDQELVHALRDDPRKRSITLEHLLTMTSGLDWPDFDKPYWELKEAKNPTAFVLGRPLAHELGDVFTYNSGGSQLLAIALERAAGESLSRFARRHLFRPLGIGPVRWNRLQGGQEGGAGLSVGMRDLAKLGRLYVQEGSWEGKQIVSADWVRQSVQPHHKGLLHYEPAVYGCYGYHWWVSPADKQPGPDFYFAFGYGGQYLFAVPSLDLTVVVRKSLDGRNKAILSRRVMEEFILPARMNS